MSNRASAKTALQGTHDLMVLQTVVMLGPLHGYAIAARLAEKAAWDRMTSIMHTFLSGDNQT